MHGLTCSFEESEKSVEIQKSRVASVFKQPVGKRPRSIGPHSTRSTGTPFGEALWQIRTAKRLDLQSTLRPRGRPQKLPRSKIRLPPPLYPFDPLYLFVLLSFPTHIGGRLRNSLFKGRVFFII
jgi:hypothetical protein